MQTEISLLLRKRVDLSLYSYQSIAHFVEPQYYFNRLIIVGHGPAVLTAGAGLKLFDFFL